MREEGVISVDIQDTQWLALGHANKTLFYLLSLSLVEIAFDYLGKTKTHKLFSCDNPCCYHPAELQIQLYISNRILVVL